MSLAEVAINGAATLRIITARLFLIRLLVRTVKQTKLSGHQENREKMEELGRNQYSKAGKVT